jgi:hypothetical protein
MRRTPHTDDSSPTLKMPSDPEDAQRYAYGDIARLSRNGGGWLSEGSGNFTLAAYNMWLQHHKADFHLHTHGTLSDWVSWEAAQATLPQGTRAIQIHYDKQFFSRPLLRARDRGGTPPGQVVVGGLAGNPTPLAGRRLGETQKHPNERNAQLIIIHKPGRAPGNTLGHDLVEAERLRQGGAPDPDKIELWARSAKLDWTERLRARKQQTAQPQKAARAKRDATGAPTQRKTQGTHKADEQAKQPNSQCSHKRNVGKRPPPPQIEAAPTQQAPQPPCDQRTIHANPTAANLQCTHTQNGKTKREH